MNALPSHPRPLILAHRGASAHAPENTLAAFRLAFEQDADGIELDVQLSADGEVVICHDGTVNRTTDGQGKVGNLTLSQLKQLDAGTWFDSRFAGERIPTLAEVFETFPAGIIDVELKPGAAGSALPDKVAALISRYKISQRVLVTSFLPHYLSRLHQILPDQPIGLLELGGLAGKFVHTFTCGWLNLAAVLPHYKAVTGKFIQAQTSAGRNVISWTVDDPTILRQHFSLNIYGVITNDPLTALKVRDAE